MFTILYIYKLDYDYNWSGTAFDMFNMVKELDGVHDTESNTIKLDVFTMIGT